MFKLIKNQKNFGQFIKEHVYRVLVSEPNSSAFYSSGSGFFVAKNKFVTCFHVIFGNELRNLIKDADFLSIEEKDQHLALDEFYKNKNFTVKIELSEGVMINANLKSFNETYDIAVLEIVDKDVQNINVCSLELEPTFFYGQEVSFGGFSNQYNYTHDKTPFAYNEGIVSSFPITVVAGAEYEHIRINSINLSGNSGAPLFISGTKKVVGMINGNMNWGRDDLLAVNQQGGMPIRVSNRIPLSIAYATSVKTFKNDEKLFHDLTS